MDQSDVSSSVSKLERNTNQDPTAYSPEMGQDDTLSSSTRQLMQSGKPASSASTRKLVRGDGTQIERTRLEIHSMQISDQRYLEKVFKNLRQKLNLAEEAPVFGVEALNTNVLIWGSFMSTTTKAAVHLGQNYTDILELYRNTKLRRAEFTRYHAEIDIGPSSRNSECIYDLYGKPPHGRDLRLRTIK